MRKLKKLVRSPGLFFRDYLIKRYPISLNEMGCSIADEAILIAHDLDLANLEASEHAPIDIVFTWVDSSDPKWIRDFNCAKEFANHAHIGPYATNAARFANHDELRFALHGVLKFLPWINNVYVVTAGQRPSWFNDHPKVTFVNHESLIPDQYLPTFNSHVIEAHLHRIPGLAEQFVYFNDDVFVARPLPKNHFFRSNGIASIFLGKKSLSGMRSRGANTPTLTASENSLKLLARRYSHFIDTPLIHTYIPLRKTAFNLAWDLYEVEIKSFLCNKFRGESDLNLASFLVPWLAYLEGMAVPTRDICYYFNIRSPSARMFYRTLVGSSNHHAPHSFCANDFRADNSDRVDYKEQLLSMLAKYYFR
ncbi:stealth family protein [Cupriavidus taiwanensis]|uniref:Capsular polysaccharide phosphotransferase LcbA n=1 Tax=Cupriavidus taiwanensis TaxID=164546 RepID=A0A375J3Y1_9BURK|nr:stealth family protein [Cupriavidus taiwanensis]SPR99898.1 Capsular polysaccharide phosphotransferase LcbA [Cupriavidus taiwanensis]